jgi:RNA polymerase sigma-70 factor (ECF subfamily)
MRDGQREATDEETMDIANPADPEAFTRIYRRYVTPVYSYIYHRVRNRSDAEDLTAQVFTEAFAGLDRYEERGKAAAWLFSIARHKVVDHYRSRRVELPFDEVLDSPLDGSGPEARVLRRERLAKLAQLVASLEWEKQELLQLRFVAELTYREISEVVGSSEAAVKKAIYRLLDQLRGRWAIADLKVPVKSDQGASDE